MWKENLYLYNFHPLEVMSRYREPQLQVQLTDCICIIYKTNSNFSNLTQISFMIFFNSLTAGVAYIWVFIFY